MNYQFNNFNSYPINDINSQRRWDWKRAERQHAPACASMRQLPFGAMLTSCLTSKATGHFGGCEVVSCESLSDTWGTWLGAIHFNSTMRLECADGPLVSRDC